MNSPIIDLTMHWVGISALVIFFLAYVLVILEEKTHLRKSKPMLIAAGIIWMLIAAVGSARHLSHEIEAAIQQTFVEYAELFFFLLVAMTYINAMIERGLFDELRNRILTYGFSYRTLFWLTGFLAFFISPIADNLTTALILCAVVLTVGKGQENFVSSSCIGIVIAANAGGAFSPFGDITTLMVWQQGLVAFGDFFQLFIPSLINYIVPAGIMSLKMSHSSPERLSFAAEPASLLKPGALVVALLFLFTIITAVCFHNFLHLPPVFGMMLGLGYLKIYGYYLQRSHQSKRLIDSTEAPHDHVTTSEFNVFDRIAQAEWDTLFFFYGVIMSVGGLSLIGYLTLASNAIYGSLGFTFANVLIGIISAVVDNIPVMFAVLSMKPDMSEWQWLLVTLTAGVGGSLLSIGSAAGVALMGQARGCYTFFTHLKWTPAIALGYSASILVHYWLNAPK